MWCGCCRCVICRSLSTIMKSGNPVRFKEAVHAFGIELPWSLHQFHLNRFYIEGRGEIEIGSVVCREQVKKIGKYMLLKEKDGRYCKEQGNWGVQYVNNYTSSGSLLN